MVASISGKSLVKGQGDFLKRVLIITYYFPPKSDIGGLRPFGLAKFLPLHGWEPIMLTPPLPGDLDPSLRIVQSPYEDVVAQWKKRFGLDPQKTINAQFEIKIEKNQHSIADYLAFIPNEIITYPDAHIGWFDNAVSTGERIIQTEQIDAIISSSYPPTCHIIAKTLVDKYHIPWIADFRDLWTQNHYSHHSWIRNFFERKLESATISQASAITTVSHPLTEKLQEFHNNKRIFPITNGFSPDILNPGIPPDNTFRIVYTGVLYQGKRDPGQFFSACKELLTEENPKRWDIQIDFFGPQEDWLLEEIKKFGLQDIVSIHGQVSREVSIEEQRKAQILLLLTWNDPAEEGVYTGKLFDYLAARRPILSMGYPEGGVVKVLLDQTRAGVHVTGEKELKEYLKKAYHEYKEFGAVQYRGIEEEVMKFSHREMANKFAGILDEIT